MTTVQSAPPPEISAPSSAPSAPSPATRNIALTALTLCTLLVHGYHPLAEDGGIYVTGIKSALDPTLFPHDLPFAIATRHYSLFAPLMAQIIRALHVPLPWLLLFANLTGTWLLLYAAWRIAAQCFRSQPAQLSAVGLLAAWFTLPIAGTSLLLMDPYVTARTFSTPLSLLAIAFALQWKPPQNRRLAKSLLALLIAATFHPLMAAYAAAFIAALLIAKQPSPRTRNIAWALLTIAAIAIAATLQTLAPPESTTIVAASFSRYYWFLSRWQWFELLGLAGPLIVLAILLRFQQSPTPTIPLARAAIALGLIATLISLLFAHESSPTHLVARLQPLRAFLLIYAIMAILLGGALANACLSRPRGAIPPLVLVAMACIMFWTQRQTFPTSQHLEIPSRTPTNPWSQAFLWARDHTPTDALFALDANYITTSGEDGQTFRAAAQRSVLPDFSKDGGEAAIRPSLADAWFAGQQAQQNLSALTPQERSTRLEPLGVTWLILHADAKTNGVCPYANAVVKVCPLNPR